MLSLTSQIVYSYNDMASLLVSGLGLLVKYDYLPLVSSDLFLSRIEVVNLLVLKYLFTFLQPIFVANILAIFYLILNTSISFILFRRIVKDRIISLMFAILYSGSVFFIFRVVSFTPNLYQLFTFPLLLYFLQFKKTKPVLLGLFVFIMFNLSAYYAYFASIFVFFWYMTDFVISEGLLRRRFALFIKKVTSFYLILLLLLGVFFLPLIMQILPVFSKYNPKDVENVLVNPENRYRPIEDFYSLTYRPWYLVIPPKSSIFFGGFSRSLYEQIKNTNYYLADDYSEVDMAGTYLGWHFILGMIIVAVLLIYKRLSGKELAVFESVYNNSGFILRCFILIGLALLVSHPPSFTISGFNFFTPTAFIFLIVPVFRTLVRWAVIINLLVLVVNVFFYYDLYKVSKSVYYRILFITAFVLLNYFIFAVRVPIINLNSPPDEVVFLKENGGRGDAIAVYPKGDFYSIFWILYHDRPLLNPQDMFDVKQDFSSNKFSKNLITLEGIEGAKKLKPKHLILYEKEINENIFKNSSNIRNIDELRMFFEEKFGKMVYSNNNVSVYERSNLND
ncbi:MAG: hypothetical protein UU77_C0008G0021 [candidate division WWE3 bacterium GW2011_GWC1_41_7]|uniref:Glycosyltransferase RgtA/B/C/D-like domain-containing protein n=3 Tax=Katanobacteria TaxID=422282 RepID=A0A0G0ZKQ1_UNCKA|nr:MAG: hypothetical protein UU72_C0002G0004 [candidate division WWE3 bacterium GW2011_GWB1_41_6]KKS21104.1 MAG: hypothetical protein UU77_C0008G0021 [candidate division WWE3 bacterium GW2011_GWC1_41_7]KKS22616.1 MAG: hypothetical protein UU80_C0004G0006 [candidate division WWE3 bacterium GW2011_GWA1_41_8]